MRPNRPHKDHRAPPATAIPFLHRGDLSRGCPCPSSPISSSRPAPSPQSLAESVGTPDRAARGSPASVALGKTVFHHRAGPASHRARRAGCPAQDRAARVPRDGRRAPHHGSAGAGSQTTRCRASPMRIIAAALAGGGGWRLARLARSRRVRISEVRVRLEFERAEGLRHGAVVAHHRHRRLSRRMAARPAFARQELRRLVEGDARCIRHSGSREPRRRLARLYGGDGRRVPRRGRHGAARGGAVYGLSQNPAAPTRMHSRPCRRGRFLMPGRSRRLARAHLRAFGSGPNQVLW